MIGDKLLYQSRHTIIADKLLPEIIKRNKCKKFIVTIGGKSGTGKSEVASLIQEKLYPEKRVKLIHVDDYYKSSWKSRNEIRKKEGINSVGRFEINWKKIKKLINHFKENYRKIYVQRIHMFTDSIEHVIVNNKKIDIIIIEGLYACHCMEADLRIYLEATNDQTYYFRKERMKEDPDNEFRKKVLAKESDEVEKSKRLSHIKVTWEGEINGS